MAKLTTLKSTLPTIGRKLATMAPGSWRTSASSSSKRGYGYRWQKRREDQLRKEPLCRYCQAEGRVTPATVADHITPHRGDKELFKGPLQSLCETCHSSVKQREEKEGTT